MGPSELRLGFPVIFYLMHDMLRSVAPHHAIAVLPLTRVYLHPTAVAAWVGMFATALNLLPSSQLDGGHIVYALAPRAHRIISWMTVIVLVYLGRMYVGWRVWAGLLIVMNVMSYRQQQAPEYPMLTPSRWPLAVLAVIMLALTFTISPFQMAWR
ncbi:MAG: site-2 protease family protein [Candidatus Sulfotelmatobacter sp.]